MIIFPAIDISGGNVVRLYKGDYNKMTVYDGIPFEIAKKYESLGATHLHVVDLDGAKSGMTDNYASIEKIAKETNLFIEVGGGIRDEERIKNYKEIGVKRVILGTVAVKNPEFAKEMALKYGSLIAAGIDVKDGYAAVHGWTETSDVSGYQYCENLKNLNIDTVIYTDISKDGTESGTNIKAYEELSKIKNLNVIASGGITYYDEIEKLSSMGVYGAILGKALYSGTLDLKKALEICAKQGG
jgi:phosphoribosylformimino-5-aminoimidazole carboxamide ribotide isomerase